MLWDWVKSLAVECSRGEEKEDLEDVNRAMGDVDVGHTLLKTALSLCPMTLCCRLTSLGRSPHTQSLGPAGSFDCGRFLPGCRGRFHRRKEMGRTIERALTEASTTGWSRRQRN